MVEELDVLAVHGIGPLDLVGGSWAHLDIGDIDAGVLLRGEVSDARISASRLRSARAADVVGTTWARLVLVSRRLRDTLTLLGITGWDSIPVGLDDSLPEDLRLLVVTGRCGPIYSASNHNVPGLPPLGQFVDPRTWDGSDLFICEGDGAILLAPTRITDLKRARLRNLRIEPAGLEPFTIESHCRTLTGDADVSLAGLWRRRCRTEVAAITRSCGPTCRMEWRQTAT